MMIRMSYQLLNVDVFFVPFKTILTASLYLCIVSILCAHCTWTNIVKKHIKESNEQLFMRW